MFTGASFCSKVTQEHRVKVSAQPRS